MHSEKISIRTASVYVARPDDATKHPGLILIEEIWGVNDHIRSVADRFANEGYVVLAPELLPDGLLGMLTPELQRDLFDPERRTEAQPKLRAAMQPLAQPEYAQSTIATLKACVDHLLADEQVNGKIAVLGFCFGGTYSFHLAAHDTRIKAAVPFYGQRPSAAEIPDISCPILALYGDQDSGLMATLPELTEDMRKDGKEFEPVIYKGAHHAFFNDTNVRTYNAEYAKDAWNKTLAFLSEKLA